MKLFVSDLDGTLLNNEQELSEKTVEIINNLIDKGMNFTIATARSLDSSCRIIKPLRLKLPMILMNGVYVYDPAAGENLVSNFVEKREAEEVLKFFEENDISPFVYTTNSQKENRVYYKGIFNKAQEGYTNDRLSKGDKRFRLVDDLKVSLDQDIIAIVCIGGDRLEEAYGVLKERYDFLIIIP